MTLDDIHELLSARNFQTRFCSAVPELPSFVGVPWDILRDSGVPVPRHLLRDPSVCSEDDAWLLHFPTTAARASYTSTVGKATAVHLMACRSCLPCLRANPARMPPLALANNNWLGPAPLELSTLTQAELLFIARGFSHVVLRQLRTAGDPRSRQQGLVGGIVAFPQDGGPLLDLLPRRAGELAEYFSVVFSSDDSDKVRSHRALLVRRTRVAAALRRLKQHNLHYADVCISEDNLAALPESAVPDVFLQAVSAGEAAHNEQGHFFSCTGLDFGVGRSAFSTLR